MDQLLARLAGGGNAQIGGIGALAGTLAGAGIYLNLSGVVFGLLIGLGMTGLLVMLAAMAARPMGIPALAVPAGSAAPMQTIAAMAAAPALAAGPPVPPAAKAEAGIAAATETEAELLGSGRFAEYHLVKARRLFADKNYKEAAIQASASLAHGDFAEAREIYKAARAAK